jgi:hypothetical protein
MTTHVESKLYVETEKLDFKREVILHSPSGIVNKLELRASGSSL